jgi:hypothetical protein
MQRQQQIIAQQQLGLRRAFAEIADIAAERDRARADSAMLRRQYVAASAMQGTFFSRKQLGLPPLHPNTYKLS